MTENRPLPDGWRWAKIDEVTLPVEKVVPQDKPAFNFTYIDISSIDNSIQMIVNPKKYQSVEAPSRARQLVRANDILFSTVRTYLKNIALLPDIYDGQIASTGFSVLRTDEIVLPKYLFYYTLSDAFLEPLNELQRGTSYPAVRDGDVRSQIFPLPPLPEQERIVAKIEALFTQLDAGTAALRRIQAELKRYKASVLKAACEGRQEDLRSKRRNLGQGELSEGMGRVTIEQISDLVTDGDHNPPKRVMTGIPHLTAKNIKGWKFDITDCTFITSEDFEKVKKRYNPKGGDVIVTCVGTIGRTAIVPKNFSFSADRNLAVIRPKADVISPQYLQIFLNSPLVQKKMMSASGSTAQPHLYLRDLRSIAISVPSLKDQLSIVTEVESKLSILSQLEITLETLVLRSTRLRQAILKRAFEGKLLMNGIQ